MLCFPDVLARTAAPTAAAIVTLYIPLDVAQNMVSVPVREVNVARHLPFPVIPEA